MKRLWNLSGSSLEPVFPSGTLSQGRVPETSLEPSLEPVPVRHCPGGGWQKIAPHQFPPPPSPPPLPDAGTRRFGAPFGGRK